MIIMGKDRKFTFDFAYSPKSSQEQVYKDTVAPLVQSCFSGYNATVLAYGQTGSGKTYTMGSGNITNVLENELGVIPRVIAELFETIEKKKSECEFALRVSFLEIHNEELRDLLDPATAKNKSDKVISIREDPTRGIFVTGIREEEVKSYAEMAGCLERGSLSRTTGSTLMNARSSRSHAIFTIAMEQRQFVNSDDPNAPPEYMSAKFHFVDLAGSERLKRTKADGERMKEGIHINSGLLALGNVISALGDDSRKVAHVPYRDSRLTRMLQDSLGGNSRTLMIACISPADVNFEETLNTLKYANRARNIKNKPIVNRDPNSAQLSALRLQIEDLQAQLSRARGDTVYENIALPPGASGDAVEEIRRLQEETGELRKELSNAQMELERTKQTNVDLKEHLERSVMERDLFRLRLESLGGPVALDSGPSPSEGILQQQLLKIRELELELEQSKGDAEQAQAQLRIMQETLEQDEIIFGEKMREISLLSRTNGEQQQEIERLRSCIRGDIPTVAPTPDDSAQSESDQDGYAGSLEDDGDDYSIDTATADEAEQTSVFGDDEVMTDVKAREFEVNKQVMEKTVRELSTNISLKEDLIRQLEKSQAELQTLKQSYEEKVTELETDVKKTQGEMDRVLAEMNNIESQSSDAKRKMRLQYEHKLEALETQLSTLRKKQESQQSVARMKSQSEVRIKTLQTDIENMKRQKVSLLKKLREESDRFREYMQNSNREITQLKRANLKSTAQVKKLEAENQKKSVMLKRRMEEVAMANAKLKRKEQKEVHPPNSSMRRPPSAPPNLSNSGPRSSPSRPSSANPSVPSTLVSPPQQIPSSPQSLSPASATANSSGGGSQGGVFAGTGRMEAWVSKEVEMWVKKNEKSEVIRNETKRREGLTGELDDCNTKRSHLQIKRERAAAASGGGIRRGSFNEENVFGEEDEKQLLYLEERIESLEEELEYINSKINDARTELAKCHDASDDLFTAKLDAMTSSEYKRLVKMLFARVVRLTQAENTNRSQKQNLELHLQDSQLNLQEALNNLRIAEVDYDRRLTRLEEEHEEKLLFLLQQIDASHHASAPASSATTPSSTTPAAAAPPPSPAARTMGMFLQPRSTSGPVSLQSRSMTGPLPKDFFAKGGLNNGGGEDGGMSEYQFASNQRLLALKEEQISILTKHNAKYAEANCSLQTKQEELLSEKEERERRLELKDNLIQRLKEHIELMHEKIKDPSMSIEVQEPMRDVFARLAAESSYTGTTRARVVAAQEFVGSTAIPRNSKPSRSARTSSTRSIAPPDDDISSNEEREAFKCIHTMTGHSGFVLALAVGGGNLYSASQDSTIKIWDLSRCIETYTLAGHTGFVRTLATSPDGRYLFSAGQDKIIRVWDTRSQNANVKVLTSHTDQVYSLCASGSKLYSGAEDNTIKVWSLEQMQCMRTLSGHKSTVFSLIVNKDTLFSGSRDHSIKVWDAATLDCKRTLHPPHLDGVNAFAVTPTSVFSGSRDKSIKQWDMSSLTTTRSVQAHSDWVCALQAVEESNLLLSASRDSSVRVWDLQEPGECLASMHDHKGPVNAMALSQNLLLTGANDRAIKVWVAQ